MNKSDYKTPEEKIGTDEIFGMIFKDSSVKYGLQEFSKDILKKVSAFQKQDGRFYVRCLKRDKDIIEVEKYIFVNEAGRRVKSEGGIFEAYENLRLDDDLDEIADKFVEFTLKQKLDFWR